MTKDRIALGLRVVGALLIVGGLATYSIYGRHFYAGFIAECRDMPGANLNDADDGTINLGYLLLLLTLSVLVLVDVATRGMRWLRRSLQR